MAEMEDRWLSVDEIDEWVKAGGAIDRNKKDSNE